MRRYSVESVDEHLLIGYAENMAETAGAQETLGSRLGTAGGADEWHRVKYSRNFALKTSISRL